MNTIIERIKTIIDNEKISVRVFEEKIGVSQGSINKSINAKTDIKGSVINRIVELYPQYNPVWLLLGKGEILIDDSREKNQKNELQNQPCPLCEEKERVIEVLTERIKELKETIAILKEQKENRATEPSSKRRSA